MVPASQPAGFFFTIPSQTRQISCNSNPFKINTCISVSKQATSSPFKINTYRKTGGRGSAFLINTLLLLFQPGSPHLSPHHRAARLRLTMSTPSVAARPSLQGFWALIAVQLQGAFSDNALKWLVSFLVLESAITKEQRDLWFVLVVPLLFAVPFLLFSIPGGYLADKFSKRSVTIWTKLFELLVMALATLALASNRLDLAGAALFLACTQGAIFGPTKYGLLPELLPVTRLSWGNGLIELTTLLAAILAALAGGFLAQTFPGRQVWSGVVFLLLTILG